MSALRIFAALVLSLILTGCAPVPTSSGLIGGATAANDATTRPAPRAPDPAERALATSILSDLQARSFAQNREFCGFILADGDGRLYPSPVSAGSESTCPLPRVPHGVALLASFHTHGTYSPFYQSEYPTVQDMLIDAATGTNGYISTPGGRLWYVDSRAMVVTQLCGRGCLPQDPFYDPAEDGDIRRSYTLEELIERERRGGL